MTPSKTSLDALAAKASKLNAKTDELNGIFESLESKLEAAKIGVSVWLEDLIDIEVNEQAEESEAGADEGWTIGYAKVGGKWRLAARRERWPFQMNVYQGSTEKTYADDTLIVLAPVPLVNAPRSVRAQAAGMLDKLIEEMSRKIDVYDENIEKAKAVASAGESVPAAKTETMKAPPKVPRDMRIAKGKW